MLLSAVVEMSMVTRLRRESLAHGGQGVGSLLDGRGSLSAPTIDKVRLASSTRIPREAMNSSRPSGETTSSRHPGHRRLLKKAGLAVLGLVAGLLLAELALAIAGLPRFYRPHQQSSRFFVYRNRRDDDGYPFYVNAPSQRIRFIYDGDPRGYFGPQNEIDHVTNSQGFRGPEFDEPASETSEEPTPFRTAFLGDPLTFGEGVRFEDTYPEVTARLLEQRLPENSPPIRSYNFGVGGYNAEQSLYLLQHEVQEIHPDLVVLGYSINDAEPRIFDISPAGHVFRVETPIEKWLGSPKPPQSALYHSRIARLAWKVVTDRRKSRLTVSTIGSSTSLRIPAGKPPETPCMP